MQVIECPAGDFEEVVSDNLIAYIEAQILKHSAFSIKSVPEGTNPARLTTRLVGYYPPYGIAYLSNPNAEAGLTGIGIATKRLVYSAHESSFFSARDAIVYSTGLERYIREGFKEVLEEFQFAGYKAYAYVPQRPGDYLSRHKDFSTVKIGAELRLIDLL